MMADVVAVVSPIVTVNPAAARSRPCWRPCGDARSTEMISRASRADRENAAHRLVSLASEVARSAPRPSRGSGGWLFAILVDEVVQLMPLTELGIGGRRAKAPFLRDTYGGGVLRSMASRTATCDVSEWSLCRPKSLLSWSVPRCVWNTGRPGTDSLPPPPSRLVRRPPCVVRSRVQSPGVQSGTTAARPGPYSRPPFRQDRRPAVRCAAASQRGFGSHPSPGEPRPHAESRRRTADAVVNQDRKRSLARRYSTCRPG